MIAPQGVSGTQLVKGQQWLFNLLLLRKFKVRFHPLLQSCIAIVESLLASSISVRLGRKILQHIINRGGSI